jgi:serine phosphatase RsbU (regulator of sigma subunit)
MPLFEVTSRVLAPLAPPRKRPSPARQRWYDILRYLNGVSVVGALFGLTIAVFHSQVLFVLLPVGVSVVITAVLARAHPYNLRALLLVTGVSLVYFGGITVWELFSHPPTTAEIIVVTTTLTVAVIFEPVRAVFQSVLERRTHVRDDVPSVVVEAITARLREEIDLDQVRETFLDVIQRVLRPQSAALWVRAPAQPASDATPTSRAHTTGNAETERVVATLVDTAPASERVPVMSRSRTLPRPPTAFAVVAIDDADPFLPYALAHPAPIDLEWSPSDSAVVRDWRSQGVELVLPLTSQGELIALLALGPRLGPSRPAASRAAGRVLDVLHLFTPLGLFAWLTLGPRGRGPEYMREDRVLLESLAAQVAPALRVAQLVRVRQAEVREHDRIDQELRTAQTIQRTFLPREVPVVPGWRLAPYYHPAREVGGDFYDFLTFADGRLGLVIGDVTGKGIPAALVMTATRTMLRTSALERPDPGEVLARVNQLLLADIPAGMFVTCFYAVLDPPTGRLRFANAGHDLPFARRASGSAVELRATGMPLGLMPDMAYDEREVTVAPGDSVLLYSDGLVEAHNGEREMFGFPRLRRLVEAHAGDAPLIEVLLTELAAFTGPAWEQEDDVTLVTLHRDDPSPDDHPASTDHARATAGEFRMGGTN